MCNKNLGVNVKLPKSDVLYAPIFGTVDIQTLNFSDRFDETVGEPWSTVTL